MRFQLFSEIGQQVNFILEEAAIPKEGADRFICGFP
jgi:hypothetical protein